jgi:predicted DCC family thiol-disulfide oxidoreductase YuxK
MLHAGAMAAILAQVCLLYFSSGLAKVAGERWQEGTALYYILRVQEFAWPALSPLVYGNAVLVTVLTYLSMLDQLAYPFMLLHRLAKRIAVTVTIGMHVGIAMLMGLVTFSMVMIIVQALVFSDAEYRSALQWVRSRGRWWRAAAARRLALHVFYDDWCPRCRRVRQLATVLDWLRVLRWHSVREAGAAALAGTSTDRLLQLMHVRHAATGRVLSGAAALGAMCRRLPAAWPAGVLLALASRAGVAEPLYAWAAARRRIVPVSSCGDQCQAPPRSGLAR